MMSGVRARASLGPWYPLGAAALVSSTAAAFPSRALEGRSPKECGSSPSGSFVLWGVGQCDSWKTKLKLGDTTRVAGSSVESVMPTATIVYGLLQTRFHFLE